MQKKLMTLAVVFALAVACSLRGFAAEPLSNADGEISVSYTHLDVYKRQLIERTAVWHLIFTS